MAGVTFGGLRHASPLLTHVAREFAGRTTAMRRELDRKDAVKSYLKDVPIAVSPLRAAFEDLRELTAEMLGDSAALKYAHGHSSVGVMLLQKIGPDSYFDHMNQLVRPLEKLRTAQAKVAERLGGGRKGWLVEDIIPSPLAGRPFPIEDKFYCFRDKIGYIIQMDRNTRPASVAVMDENYVPLELGKDYTLIKPKHQPGIPLVPYHAEELKYFARTLSVMTDSPFVRIDLYDGPSGPVFGEFTFSPGSIHNQWCLYSTDMLRRMDELFAEASAMATPQIPPPPEGIDAVRLPVDLWRMLASSAAMNHSLAYQRLTRLHERLARRAKSPDLAAVASRAATAWGAAASLWEERFGEGLKARRALARGNIIHHKALPF